MAQDNEDGYHAFDGFTARCFDADIHVVSLSGWGVACGWENRAGIILSRGRSPIRPSTETTKEDGLWDFTGWQPDALVINLGSNDSSSTDDDPDILSDEEFRDKTVEFLLPAQRLVSSCPDRVGAGNGGSGERTAASGAW